MDEHRICPYPGLRPFNDDESIFFKGRDHNIDVIVELFEKKKFMMVTGASGDGKSSLIYAGVVPHARAGLFKAKFNNWAIADFRPERDPLGNLSQSLHKFFPETDNKTLKKELSYGFSSLINIYKNSSLYLDTKSEKYLQADEKEKKQLKRKASNLLIIADQFEEFFTNSENYHNGIASVDSQTTVNILLETAKIALAEDIPVYVICTMRSDYIGQCAAFRGLPEYIGFGQFFVPRLKRNEITQVIEEPAMLNGDKINHRLTERLLNDITEGYDQLPILQHALNQIWKAADNGKEMLDLIHYAMVGGISVNELPEEDQEKYNKWFEKLPDFKKTLLEKPSLGNILNAHANELMEKAWDNFSKQGGTAYNGIDSIKAKNIIRAAFSCLTKIDEARAVRNRMTVQEITEIIADAEVNAEVVGKVLDIFREQGNTFIRPFISENPESKKTGPGTVLDITHESLIRNWQQLTDWANEEYDNLVNWQDFSKQLKRWVEHGKVNGYLLPIGPLTFFETWYKTVKPNKYWLARYDNSEDSANEKLERAAETLSNAQAFIRQSARKLFFSRTILKYGANKLLLIAGIIVLMASCTYYYFDFRKKQNASVLTLVEERGNTLIHSNKVSNKIKSHYLIAEERLHPGSFISSLNSLHNDTLAYDLAYATFLNVQNLEVRLNKKIPPLVFESVDYMGKFLEKNITNPSNAGNDIFFKRYLEYIRLYIFLKSNLPGHKEFDPQIQNCLSELYNRYVKVKLSSAPGTTNKSPILLNGSIETIINHADSAKFFASEILKYMSPFGDEKSAGKFNDYFNVSQKIKIDWNNQVTHNGGYQLTAYLYSLSGNDEKIIQCLDSINKYNPTYKSFNRSGFGALQKYFFTNPSFSIEKTDRILAKFEAISSQKHLKLIETNFDIIPYIQSWDLRKDDPLTPYGNFIPTILAAEPSALIRYYEYTLKNEISNPEELSFKQAMLYKRLGYWACSWQKDSVKGKEFFKRAYDLYSTLSENFIMGNFELGNPPGDSKTIKRFELFLYPKIIDETNSWSPFWINASEPLYFYNYLSRENNITEVFNGKEKTALFRKLLYNFYNNYTYAESRTADTKMLDKLLEDGNALMEKNHPDAETFDPSFFNLIKSIRSFKKGDSASAFRFLNIADAKIIYAPAFQTGEDVVSSVNKNLLASLAEQLAFYGKTDESFKALKSITEGYMIRNCLINICLKIDKHPGSPSKFIYADTLYGKIEKKPKYGLKLYLMNGITGSQQIFDLSQKLFKDSPDKDKPRALLHFIRGVCYEGLYYRALQYIPDYASSSNELELYTEIIRAEIFKREGTDFLDMKENLSNPYYYYDLTATGEEWGMGDYEDGETGNRIFFSGTDE